MRFLETTLYGNPVERWLLALGVTALLYAGLLALRTIAHRHLLRLAERTATDVDDLLAGVVERTARPFLFFVALYAGARFLDFPGAGPTGRAPADTLLHHAGVLVLALQVGVWGGGLADRTVKRQTARRLEEDPAAATTLAALGFVGKLAFWSVLALLALDNVGIEIGPLLAGLGVGGIAVALALQNVLGDLLASLSIVLDKPFVLGDFVIVGEHLGTVEKIGLKTTRIRSLSGEQLVLSNNDMLASRIRNFKRMFERRVVFGLGATYQTPPDVVERIPGVVREAIEAQEDVRFDRAHFKAFGASSLDFEAVYYVLSPDYNLYMDRQQAINLRIMRRFQEEGVEFAYPTQTLFLEGSGSRIR